LKSDDTQKKPKSKKRISKQDRNGSVASKTEKANESKADETAEKKEVKKKKKKRSSVIENHENGDGGVIADQPPDFKTIVQSVDVEPAPSEEVANEEENVLEQLENIIDEEELNLVRKDRNRRSSSPKSRYRMDDSDAATEVEADKLASSKKKTKKASSEEDKGKKKKKKKKAEKSVSEEKDQSVSEKKKKTKSASPKKASKKTGSKTYTDGQQTEILPPELPVLSAAVSGSFESDTMEFVRKKSSHLVEVRAEDKPLDEIKNSEKKGKKKKNSESYNSNTQSLKREKKKGKSLPHSQSVSGLRRASVDQGVVSSGKHSMSSSQSFSSIEEQKKFRKELKEASKSEHDLSDLASSIDSNIVMKKSGLVKGKSTSSSRPSIFNQSSSPEPEMTSMTSLTSTERDFQQDQSTEDGESIPDPDFKVKKSGKVVGRKTSTTGPRPSILDEQASEGKYNWT